MAADRRSARTVWVDSALIFVAGLALYVLTLAPTVLWGDDAELQRLAATPGSINPGRGHALWIALARLFVLIPWGDPARRANLVSAVFGALTLPLVYATVRHLFREETLPGEHAALPGAGRAAAWLGAATLALSHTFWLHAVRAEVYTLHTFVLAAFLALALRWADEPARLWTLAGAALVAGVGLNNHVLILTLAPAFAWLIWRRAGRIGPAESANATAQNLVMASSERWQAATTAVAAFALGAAPYLLALPAALGDPLARPLSNFRPFSVGARDLALAGGSLVYQFPLSLPLAGIGLIFLWHQGRDACAFLALAYAASAGFALCFRVPDQFVFYLPSYVIVAVLIGAGAAKLRAGAGRRAAAEGVARRPALLSHALVACLAGLIVIPPMAVYHSAPALIGALGLRAPEVREIPGRDASFFLSPAKNGYLGAREFAEGAFAVLPQDAVILADWTLAQPLRYVQEVERRRADVTIKTLGAGWGLQTPYLLEQSATRAVFLAATDRYYDMEEIGRWFSVVSAGPIHRLIPAQGPGGGSRSPRGGR